MYSNIGGKIKGVAMAIAVIGALSSIVAGVMMIDEGNGYHGNSTLVGLGWFFIIGGPILSWIGSMTLYGFGELIDKTQEIHWIMLQKSVTDKMDKVETQGYHNANQKQRKTWVCPTCGYVNDISSMYCQNCSRQ